MGALLVILVACLVLWGVVALACALAPYMIGVIAFVAALWLIFVGGTVMVTILGAWIARRDRRG